MSCLPNIIQAALPLQAFHSEQCPSADREDAETDFENLLAYGLVI
jgi:hypothetical protein